MRQRCYQCYRPVSLCFCEAIPRIDNRTNVLILQHVGERYHPFNTARIVHRALRRCDLIADHNRRFSQYDLPIHAKAGLLFPSPDAPSLTELPVNERPGQLVIVDGTWHQARTIVRDVPRLRGLPCYRLSPSTPGEYRIRREPDAQSLSTLEATVAALKALESDTVGLDGLLTAFHRMVDSQLRQLAHHAVSRHKRRRPDRPRYLPQALLQHADRLVVAYGESSSREASCLESNSRPSNSPPSPRMPVSWVAKRLGTGEQFCCHLRQTSPLPAAVLKHMRLSDEILATGATHDEFRERWQRFIRRDDVLIVYHHRTFQLLKNIEAEQLRCLVLKSIFRKWHSNMRSLEELLAAEGIAMPTAEFKSRGQQRLEMATALVSNLRESVSDRFRGRKLADVSCL